MELNRINTKAAAEKGITFTVLQPYSNEETDFKISVVGAGSKVHRKALQQYHLEKEELEKQAKKDKMDALELEDAQTLLLAKFIAACTTGWKGLTDDGKEVEFSFETAVNVYTCSPEVMAQTVAQIGELQKMLGEQKASSVSSAK